MSCVGGTHEEDDTHSKFQTWKEETTSES